MGQRVVEIACPYSFFLAVYKLGMAGTESGPP